jgi:hypothetical protein
MSIIHAPSGFCPGIYCQFNDQGKQRRHARDGDPPREFSDVFFPMPRPLVLSPCKPIALAVLRLMANSTFIACWTGKSAGLAPLRIPADVDSSLAIGVRKIDSVAHQAAGSDAVLAL